MVSEFFFENFDRSRSVGFDCFFFLVFGENFWRLLVNVSEIYDLNCIVIILCLF